MANIVIPAQTITKTITGSGNGQSVGSKKIVLNTKDTYVPENIEVNVSATVNVAAATLANAATSGQTYTENTANATIIPAGGSLYINKGWINNTKITLGHMIPDDADYTNAGVAHIRSGFEAYDPDGNKLIGTMPDTELSSSGGEMSGTLTVTGGTINVTPKVTGTGVSSTQGQTYGVTTTQPTSGTDGTNYLTFNPDADGGSVTNSGSITVTRAKVETTGIAGYYDGTTEELSSGTKDFTKTATTSTSIKDGTNYYMPIVTIAGTGGAVSKSSGSGSVTGTKPNVTVSYSGKFTEVGTSGVGRNYGVIEGTPESGTDGTNFLTIVTTATPGAEQTWSGTATINYSRAAVTAAAAKAGAIKVTTSTSLLASTTGSLTQEISGNVQATVSGAKTYSIPIVSVSHSGGVISGSASGSQGTRAKTTTTNYLVGKTSTGTTVSATDYGFAQNSETTATNGYVTIYASTSSSATPTCVVTATANASAVTYTNSAGAIAAHNATEAVAAKSNVELTGTTVTLSEVDTKYTSGKRSFRVPIVEPKGTGGVVSVSATASISPVGEDGSTAPEVNIDYSGYINDHASDYGIVYEEPSGFADGDNYSLLRVSNTNTDGSIVGSVSGSYSRTAVNADASYKGVVNMSSSTQLLAAKSNQPISGTFTTGSIGAEVTGQKNIYIPISQHSINGGEMTLGTFSVSGPKTLTMTPSTSFKKGTGSSGSASSATIADYGISTSKPANGWVMFDPVVSNGTATSGTQSISLTGTASINRAAVTATATPGITKSALWSQAASTEQFTGTGSWSYSLESGTSYYIPVVSPTATVTHTKTDAEVSTSEIAAFKVQGTGQQLPAGVKILSTEPSDLNTHNGGYIIIEPSVSTTDGSATATGKASINKGITTGATNVASTQSTLTIGITNNGATNKCYIKVYKAEDGGYSIT